MAVVLAILELRLENLRLRVNAATIAEEPMLEKHERARIEEIESLIRIFEKIDE